MVGLVIVSHIRAIAEEVASFAQKIGNGNIPIAFCGGKSGDYQEAGADVEDVITAIKSVYSDDGVMVLADMGSAVRISCNAIMQLKPELPNVVFSSAPIVEGAISAAAHISLGSALKDVLNEAQNTFLSKEAILSYDNAIDLDSDNTLKYTFTVLNPYGLHARPSAVFINTISSFDANVKVRNVTGNTDFVNAKSLNKLALSNINYGDVVEVVLSGPEREKALEMLKEFVNTGYNENSLNLITQKMKSSENYIKLSPGVGLGVLFVASGKNQLLTPHSVADPNTEILKLEDAINKVHSTLVSNKNGLIDKKLYNEAAIFDAQCLILKDEDFLKDVHEEIISTRTDAASVYQRKILNVVAQFKDLKNEYMRERVADVEDIAFQVINSLLGIELQTDKHFADNMILYAEYLTPSFINKFSGKLKGILTKSSGLTSHANILARAFNIPVISGYILPAGVNSGAFVAMDADKPEVVINPDSSVSADFKARLDKWRLSLSTDLEENQKQALTVDGKYIKVYANVGDERTAELAKIYGAEGIGLLRTEFLYLNRHSSPTEEEQIIELKKIFEYFKDSQITVRTLDIGGDKVIPWLGITQEASAQSGIRGIRLCRKEKKLFETQLRAILRASHGYNVRIMLPMICSKDEIDFAKEMILTAHQDLTDNNINHLWPIKTGIMVETPAAVLLADEFAEIVDFFSIGTNDLAQYVMSVEREAGKLGMFNDFMQPAVLKAIDIAVKSALKHNIEISVCGEMASDPTAAAYLLDIGVRELSMNASSIGNIKKMIRTHS